MLSFSGGTRKGAASSRLGVRDYLMRRDISHITVPPYLRITDYLTTTFFPFIM